MRRLERRLRTLTAQGAYVRVSRPFPGEPHLVGTVSATGRSLVVLRQFHDFYCEGFVALGIDKVSSIRRGRHERFFEGLLAKEAPPPPEVRANILLDSWRALLAGLAECDECTIVECESEDVEGDDLFHIGRIVRIAEDAVQLHGFDPSAIGTGDRRASRTRRSPRCSTPRRMPVRSHATCASALLASKTRSSATLTAT